MRVPCLECAAVVQLEPLLHFGGVRNFWFTCDACGFSGLVRLERESQG